MRPLPVPTNHAPGSPGKIRELRGRLGRGEELFSQFDSRELYIPPPESAMDGGRCGRKLRRLLADADALEVLLTAKRERWPTWQLAEALNCTTRTARNLRLAVAS